MVLNGNGLTRLFTGLKPEALERSNGRIKILLTAQGFLEGIERWITQR